MGTGGSVRSSVRIARAFGQAALPRQQTRAQALHDLGMIFGNIFELRWIPRQVEKLDATAVGIHRYQVTWQMKHFRYSLSRQLTLTG